MKKTLSSLIIIVTLTLASITLSILFWHNIDSQKYKIADINNNIKTRYKNDTAVNKLRKLVSGAQDDQQILAGHFLRKSSTVDFLNTLEDIGNSTNVSTNIGNIIVSKDGNSLTISVSAEGAFQNAYNYMYLIEQLPYLVKIQSFRLTKGTNILIGGRIVSTWNLNTTFSINSYIDTE